VELAVVVPIFVVVTALVLVTLVTAYAAESSVQATTQAGSQVTLAFMDLDNEVRYAADINQPGSYNNNYYVELQSNWTQNAAQGQDTCTQLEYNNSSGVLEQHSWLVNATPPTGWQVLASDLKTSVASNPFSLSAPTGTPWQLSVTLAAAASVGQATRTAQSAFTLTSLDTTSTSTDTGVCGGTP